MTEAVFNKIADGLKEAREAAAALTALCTFRPDIAAVLRGEADTREAAAWAAGAAAMREMSKNEAYIAAYNDDSPLTIANRVGALPLPPMPTQGGNADE